MKVQQLLEMLHDYDPDAEVLIATRDRFPWDCKIAGVCTREDIILEEDEEDEANDEPEKDTKENDVIIAMGDQLRYGSAGIWGAI
jgi:hypothetical protein